MGRTSNGGTDSRDPGALGDESPGISGVTADQLRRLLDRAGLSQRGAAKALDINERTMRKYAAGGSPIPKTVELALLYLATLL